MEKAAAMEDTDLKVKDYLAVLYAKQKDFQKAVDICKLALAKLPPDVPITEKAVWWDYLKVYGLDNCDFDGAVRAAREQYTVCPTDPEPVINFIDALQSAKRLHDNADTLLHLGQNENETHPHSMLAETLCHYPAYGEIIIEILKKIVQANHPSPLREFDDMRLAKGWAAFGLQIFDGAIEAAKVTRHKILIDFRIIMKAEALFKLTRKHQEAKAVVENPMELDQATKVTA